MKRIVLVEGVVEVNKAKPVLLDKNCNVMQCDSFEHLVGGFKRETGYTSLNVIDHALERLNGKKVKIIIEIEEG